MAEDSPPSSAAGGNVNFSSTSTDMNATMHAPLRSTSSSTMASNQASARGLTPTGQGLAGAVNQQQPPIHVGAPLQSHPAFATPELVSAAGDSTIRSGDSSPSVLRGMPILNVPNSGTHAYPSSSMWPNSYSIPPAGQQIGSFFIRSSPSPSPIPRVAAGSSGNYYYSSRGPANGYPGQFQPTSTPLPSRESGVSHANGQAASYNYGGADGQTTSGFAVFLNPTPAPPPSRATHLNQQAAQGSSHESTGVRASSGGFFHGSSPGPSSRATGSSSYYHNSHGPTTGYPVRPPLTSTPLPSRGSNVSNQATGQASSDNYGSAEGSSTDFALVFSPMPATQPSHASRSSQGQASNHQSPGVHISYSQQNRRNFFHPPPDSNPVTFSRGSAEIDCRFPHPQQLGAAGGGQSALASNPPGMSFDGAVRMRCSERPAAGSGQGLAPSIFECYRTFQATLLARREAPAGGSSSQQSGPMQATGGRQPSLQGRYTYTGSDHRVEDDVTTAGAGVGQRGSAQPDRVVDAHDPPAAATVQQQRPTAGLAPAAATSTLDESMPVSSNTSTTALVGSASAGTPTTTAPAVGTGIGRPSSADQPNGGAGPISPSANDESDHPRRSVIASRGQYSRRQRQHPEQQPPPQPQPQQPQFQPQQQPPQPQPQQQQPAQPQPQQQQPPQPQPQQQQRPVQRGNNRHAIPESHDQSRPYRYPVGVLRNSGVRRIEQWVWSGYVSNGSSRGGARRVYFCGSCPTFCETLEDARRHADEVAAITVSCFMCHAFFGTNEEACLAHMLNDHQVSFNNPVGNVEVDEDGLEPGEIRPPLPPPPPPSPSASSLPPPPPTSPTDQQSPTFSPTDQQSPTFSPTDQQSPTFSD